MTCCIIDDEPLAVKLLASYVEKTPGLTLSATYSSAVEALDGLARQSVDLIFCDIQMPDLNGLQFAEMMKSSASRIIFTTAFSEYALESWKVDALHYLLKPISYSDFLAAVTKARQWFGMTAPAATPQPEEAGESPLATEEMDATLTEDTMGQTSIVGGSMFVKSDYKLVRISFDDILYIEGLKDYVKIYIATERRPILSLTSMRAVEAALPAAKFMRTHRSFIVNMSRVTAFERGHLLFDDKHIPVSDTYRDAVLEYINARTLQGRREA